MHNETVIYVTPTPNEANEENTTPVKIQLQQCLKAIETTLADSGFHLRDILKQTIFYADTNDDFQVRKDEMTHDLKNFYGPYFPPTGFVGQPPIPPTPPTPPAPCAPSTSPSSPADGALMAVELVINTDCPSHETVSRKELEGIRYLTIETSMGKALYASGITAEKNAEGILRQSRTAFEKMKKILNAENMDFSHVVRQWNYIENITGTTPYPEGIRQNYQVFCDVRSLYYEQADFKNGYPAATGIGMDRGGVVLEFIAVDSKDNEKETVSTPQKIIPIVNPDQLNAHGYSQEVLVGGAIDGLKQKTTPKFERAKGVATENGYYIYVSGTASIRGQHTVHPSDVEKQTGVTCENIARLISAENLNAHGLPTPTTRFSYSHIRVYVKNTEDVPQVKSVCNHYFKDIPALYLKAEVCRENLLVEIESGGYLCN